MNKSTLVGLLLIFLLFLGYSLYLSPSKAEREEQQRIYDSTMAAQRALQDSLNLLEAAASQTDSVKSDTSQELSSAGYQQRQAHYAFFANSSEEPENMQYTVVENDFYRLFFSPKGARICKVELKNVYTYDSLPVVLFDEQKDGKNRFGMDFVSNYITLNTGSFFFVPMQSDEAKTVTGNDSLEIAYRLYPDKAENELDTSSYISFVYTIRGNDYLTALDVRFVGMDKYIIRTQSEMNLFWQLQLQRQEKNLKNELMATTVYYSDAEDVEHLVESDVKSDSASYTTALKWISFKQQFFTSTIIARDQFSHGSFVVDAANAGNSEDRILKTMRANIAFPVSDLKNEHFTVDFYFGPNKYKLLKQHKIKLEGQIQLGGKLVAWINKFAVIPTFNFFSRFNWSYGLIILILTVLLKVLLLPVTYANYRSSAKMRVMKPEIEQINAKYPKPEDAMKKQQATMALYKQVGIKPAGGCLPMLLQWPILVAMFRFFPASYELRQQPFLWAKDLSTYDSILDLPFTIPLYGDHVSLFTLLMTAATLAYTIISSKQMAPTGNEQSMKMMRWMMYLMPIMFLGIFNNYSAGLSYYYLLFNLTTFAQMFIFKYAVNDEKLRAKLLAKKKQPVKKSKWEERMEKMMKEQQAMQRSQSRK